MGYLPVVLMLCYSYQILEVLLCVFIACYSFSFSCCLLITPFFVQVHVVEDDGATTTLDLLDHHARGLLLS